MDRDRPNADIEEALTDRWSPVQWELAGYLANALVVTTMVVIVLVTDRLSMPNVLLVVVAYPVGILLHELVHAIAWVLVGAPIRSVTIGLEPTRKIPYCGCRAPLTLRQDRVATAAPLVVLGIIPAIVAGFVGSGTLALFAALMIGCAAGDVIDLFVAKERLLPPAPQQRMYSDASPAEPFRGTGEVKRSALRDALAERDAA